MPRPPNQRSGDLRSTILGLQLRSVVFSRSRHSVFLPTPRRAAFLPTLVLPQRNPDPHLLKNPLSLLTSTHFPPFHTFRREAVMKESLIEKARVHEELRTMKARRPDDGPDRGGSESGGRTDVGRSDRKVDLCVPGGHRARGCDPWRVPSGCPDRHIHEPLDGTSHTTPYERDPWWVLFFFSVYLDRREILATRGVRRTGLGRAPTSWRDYTGHAAPNSQEHG